MDNVSKMRGQLKKSLRQRDTLIPTEERPSPAPVAAAPKQSQSPHTETTTLPLSKEQKALIEDLGTKLQRQKVGPKKPELNWKSILRGMIGLLDEHTFDGVSVATEEELHQVIKKKFGR
jgi:hypothetical protein